MMVSGGRHDNMGNMPISDGMSLSKFQELVMDREAGVLQFMGSQ